MIIVGISRFPCIGLLDLLRTSYMMRRTFDRALLILSVAPTLSAIVQCKFMAVLLAGRLRSALGVGTTGPAKDRLKALRSSA